MTYWTLDSEFFDHLFSTDHYMNASLSRSLSLFLDEHATILSPRDHQPPKLGSKPTGKWLKQTTSEKYQLFMSICWKSHLLSLLTLATFSLHAFLLHLSFVCDIYYIKYKYIYNMIIVIVVCVRMQLILLKNEF